jgi:ribonuclease HI
VLELTFDGLCAPNPGGTTTYGFVVRSGGRRLAYGYGLAATPRTPEATNNVAEFTGLIRGLERLVAQGLAAQPLAVRGDSRIVIDARLKDPKLTILRERAGKLLEEFPGATVEHIPREQNWEADTLTQLARASYERAGFLGDVTRCVDPEELARLKSGTPALPEARTTRRAALTIAGIASAGGAVLRDEETTLLTRGYYQAGVGPNAVVYRTLGHVLRFLRTMNARWDLTVRTDVQFIERQLAGQSPVGPDLYEALVDAERDARGVAMLTAARADPGEDLALAKKLARYAAKARRDVAE